MSTFRKLDPVRDFDLAYALAMMDVLELNALDKVFVRAWQNHDLDTQILVINRTMVIKGQKVLRKADLRDEFQRDRDEYAEEMGFGGVS